MARALHASRQSASRWYLAWKRGGQEALCAAGRDGRKPRLDRQQLAPVENGLLQGARAHNFGTDLWTLPRVAAVTEQRTGVRYRPGHEGKIPGAINWSLPIEPRARRGARQRESQVKSRKGSQTAATFALPRYLAIYL